MNIPNDPMMLLSYINTQLRDNYPSLEELCGSLQLSEKELHERLAAIDYEYDSGNRLIVDNEDVDTAIEIIEDCGGDPEII